MSLKVIIGCTILSLSLVACGHKHKTTSSQGTSVKKSVATKEESILECSDKIAALYLEAKAAKKQEAVEDLKLAQSMLKREFNDFCKVSNRKACLVFDANIYDKSHQGKTVELNSSKIDKLATFSEEEWRGENRKKIEKMSLGQAQKATEDAAAEKEQLRIKEEAEVKAKEDAKAKIDHENINKALGPDVQSMIDKARKEQEKKDAEAKEQDPDNDKAWAV